MPSTVCEPGKKELTDQDMTRKQTSVDSDVGISTCTVCSFFYFVIFVLPTVLFVTTWQSFQASIDELMLN